jgi:hypothetical protein
MLLMIALCAFSFANLATEYSKARETLKERGEVYFKFYIDSPTEFRKTDLCNVVSVDRIDYSSIYAYANEKEFEKFLKHGYDYEVLLAPGLQTEVEMSNTYDDPVTGSRFEFYRYPTYSAYLGQMNHYANDFPNLTKLDTLGWTATSRSHVILCLRVESDIDKTNGKPKYLNTSTIHGDEVLNYMNALHMIDTLLESYGNDQRITTLIDNIDFYFCPNINPDATYLTSNETVQGARRYNVENNFDCNRNYPCGCGRPNHDIYGLHDARATETKHVLALHDKYHFTLGEDFHSGAETILWPFGFKRERVCDEDWHKYLCKQFADQVHEDCNNNGYLTSWCGPDGMGHLFTEMYEAHGTRLDYQVYYGRGKTSTPETSDRKILEESNLRSRWIYLKEAQFQTYELLLTGIQGFVTDTFTHEPIFNAKMTRNNDFDNAEVFSDSLGFYCRYTSKGNYTLTFSADGYKTKEFRNFEIDDYGKKYPLDVELCPPVSIINGLTTDNIQVSVIPSNRGIRIACDQFNSDSKVEIYNLTGKLVKVLPVYKKEVIWNGMNNRHQNMNNGCYICRVIIDNKALTKNFTLNR